MLRARRGGTVLMCALAATAVTAVVFSGFSVLDAGERSGPRGPTVLMPAAPDAMVERARMIEGAFEHVFDDIDPSADEKKIMLAVAQTLRPDSEFLGDYEVVICQVGVRGDSGNIVVSVKLVYELRDDHFSIERELNRSVVFAGGGRGE